MVEVGLANYEGENHVVIHGVKQRIEFLRKQSERGKIGGKASSQTRISSTHKAKPKRNPSERSSSVNATAQPYTLTLTPTPAHTPALLSEARNGESLEDKPKPENPGLPNDEKLKLLLEGLTTKAPPCPTPSPHPPVIDRNPPGISNG
jgi:hypothetical protein